LRWLKCIHIFIGAGETIQIMCGADLSDLEEDNAQEEKDNPSRKPDRNKDKKKA
jgi:hypothetical protein